MSDARVPLLLNRSSGSAPADPAAFAAAIDARLEPRVLEPAEVPVHVARAAAQGLDVVAVAGGDGTLRGAAEALLGSDTALLPVPAGTLNHFARRVGIDAGERAAAALRAGRAESVPVGRFGEHVFLNTLTFGEYAHVLRVRGRLKRYLTKWPAAAAGFVAALVRGRVLELTFEVDGREVRRRTAFVWIGVGWGSFPLVHEAPEQRKEPDLEIAVLRAQTALGAAAFLLRLGARLLRSGTPVRDPALEVFHARRLTLHARHRVDATADAEIFRLAPPVAIAVAADGLRVLLPPDQERGANDWTTLPATRR